MVKNNKNIDEKYSYYYDIIKDSPNIDYKRYDTKFTYGVDEYFINKTLTEYLIDNKLPIAINFKFEIASVLYFMFEADIYINKIKMKLLEKIINNILKNIKFEYKKLSILEKYEIIDKIIISNNNFSFTPLHTTPVT